MKNIFLSLIAMLTLGSNFAMAATNDVLELKASVDQFLLIEFTNEDSENLNLSPGVDHYQIAKLHVVSNSGSGYEISWQSQNNGVLVHKTNPQNNPNAKVAYTLSGSFDEGLSKTVEFSLADTQTTPLILGDAEEATVDHSIPLYFTSAATLVENVNSAESTNKSATQMLAGYYEDVITATISAR